MIRVVVCLIALGVVVFGLMSCATPSRHVGDRLQRTGDEIMVAGQLFHIGAPVVLWTDPGGYDAYRVERRFVPIEQASWDKSEGTGPRSPNRYSVRTPASEADMEAIRGGGWTLEQLQEVVDQFVLHYDVCGTSRTCFRVLHDLRGLSVHFMLDVDGTIYQTLDLKERAWHATIANNRSIGIEIANIGAYPPDKENPLDEWYATDANGKTRFTLPERFGNGGVRTPGFLKTARPARDGPIVGEIQGRTLEMYDLTDAQYESLIKLTAALSEIFPKMKLDYPRNEDGDLLTETMERAEFDAFGGLIAHYHIQNNKIDPGPAFDWDRVIEGAKKARGKRLD